jgi:acetoacetate decarboxylase
MAPTDERYPGTTVPPAPWVLRGRFVLAPGLVRSHEARRFLPSGAELVSLLPGLTLGGIALVDYVVSPVGPYHELLVIAGLARCDRRLGLFVSHAYVDSPLSRTAGRELWGLPKELAEFRWEQSGAELAVAVTAGRELVRCEVEGVGLAVPIGGRLACLSALRGEAVVWGASGPALVRLASGRVGIDSAAPFRALRPEVELPKLLGRTPALLVSSPSPLERRHHG